MFTQPIMYQAIKRHKNALNVRGCGLGGAWAAWLWGVPPRQLYVPCVHPWSAPLRCYPMAPCGGLLRTIAGSS